MFELVFVAVLLAASFYAGTRMYDYTHPLYALRHY